MTIEHIARAEQQALADKVTAYWSERGHTVNVELVPIHASLTPLNPETGKAFRKVKGTPAPKVVVGFTLKSDMVMGWPKALYESHVNALKAVPAPKPTPAWAKVKVPRAKRAKGHDFVTGDAL